MTVHRSLLSLIALSAPLLASCGGDVKALVRPAATQEPAAPTCDELKTGDVSHLEVTGGGELQQKFRTQLAAAHAVAKTATQFERDLIAACAELGTAAGLGEKDLKADPDQGHGAERVCIAASTKVGQLVKRARDAKIDLTIEVENTKCYNDIDAIMKCLDGCGVTPARVDLRAACTGGDVSGTCTGRCPGPCQLDPGECSGACRAVCTGKCDRDFRGVCGGKCDGTCDGVRIARKVCAGTCDGRCDAQAEGHCGGRCDGRCSGTWEPRDPSRCGGNCGGICAGGELKAPQCTGEFAPPGIETTCQSACSARAALAARCEQPVVKVVAKGGKQNADLQRLFWGLQIALPKILRLAQGPGKRLPRAMEGVISAGVDLSNAAATAGPKPLFCLRASREALREAQGVITVSAKATEGFAGALKEGAPPPAPPPAQ
jgi:hypothetical protein